MSYTENLRTERLHIRPISDVAPEAIQCFLVENRFAHSRWQPARDEDYFQLDKVKERVARESVNPAERRYVMFTDHSHDVIGMINFTNLSGPPFRACNLGFAIAATHEGCGYMREALSITLSRAFEDSGLNRIMANFMPRNFRSARLLSGLGFEVEGFAKEYLCIAGEWEDHILTSVRRSRWLGRGMRGDTSSR